MSRIHKRMDNTQQIQKIEPCLYESTQKTKPGILRNENMFLLSLLYNIAALLSYPLPYFYSSCLLWFLSLLLKIFLELLANERAYIRDLETIITDYIQPLRKKISNSSSDDKGSSTNSNISSSGGSNSSSSSSFNSPAPTSRRERDKEPLVKMDDMASLFSNIEDLHKVHEIHSTNLEALTRKWPFVDGIGQCFLDLAPSLRDYGIFVKNSKTADDTLTRLMKVNT